MWPNCADCCNTWLRSDHIASQNSSRCDLADPVQITMYEDTEMSSMLACTFTHFLLFLFSPLSHSVSGGSMARKGRERTANVRWRVWLVSTWWESRNSLELVPNHPNHTLSSLSFLLSMLACLFVFVPAAGNTWLHFTKIDDNSPGFNFCKVITSTKDGNNIFLRFSLCVPNGQFVTESKCLITSALHSQPYFIFD